MGCSCSQGRFEDGELRLVNTLLLHSKCIGGLGVELHSALPFVCFAAEEGETTAGALSCFVCLEVHVNGEESAWSSGSRNLL